jgi:hypothetical protein
MEYSTKIDILEVKRAQLEAELSMVAAAITSEEEGSARQQRLSAKEHDLNQRIIAVDTQITAYVNAQARQLNVDSAVFIRVILVGWRRYVGLREKVTNCARRRGAHGYVRPSNFDILLELRFKAPEACANFESDLRSATTLYNLRLPKFDMQFPPPHTAAFPFVESYQRIDEMSPDREASATTPERRMVMRHQVYNYQRIENVPEEADMCHLIPRRIVSSKADQWCFLFASTIFNRYTDAKIPTVSFRIGGRAEHAAVVENRTALLLTVDFSACSATARSYFRSNVVNTAEWNGWEATIPVHIVADQEALLRETIRWRTDSIARFRDVMKDDPTNPQHHWYTVVPLDSQDDATGKFLYEHLALYKVPVKSCRRFAEQEEKEIPFEREEELSGEDD